MLAVKAIAGLASNLENNILCKKARVIQNLLHLTCLASLTEIRLESHHPFKSIQVSDRLSGRKIQTVSNRIGIKLRRF